jgi:acetyl-CoA carboxylase carboxyl transferase subunit beta
LTEPTFGGVTASFGTLGDIIIAEQGARMGFAGRRVIEQTIRQKLPSDFQTAEYFLKHGQVDMICSRDNLKNTISSQELSVSLL